MKIHQLNYVRNNTISTKNYSKTLTNNKQIKSNLISQLHFKGRPWELPNLQVKSPYDAIVLYNYLKTGNYLDSSDDDVSFENKDIRKNNLAFLDKINTTKDKQTFIEYYKDITGFPDLEKVSKKIEQEFILGIKKSSIGIEGGECIAAGYDETCSVGKKRAFPGSDLDKAFIILKGSQNGEEEEDNKIINQFKSNLWNNIDQRILSFNHDISFPSIYTQNQIVKNIKMIDNSIEGMKIDSEHLKKIMDEEYVDLESAAQYNIAVSYYFPIKKYLYSMNKEEVKNFGYFIESVRDGKYLIKEPELDGIIGKIKNSNFYKYSNVAQIQAMRKAINEGRENKTKILIRENLAEKFDNWNTEKQYEFVKTLIKYSCEDNDNFKEYFTNDRNVKDAYKPLLNQLTCGYRNIYNRPEYTKIESGLMMKYAKDKTVNLYKGYENNVLWIDSNDETAINQVVRHINKIKQCELFKDVTKIQCPKPNSDIEKFYPIQYKTVNSDYIYEMDLQKCN